MQDAVFQILGYLGAKRDPGVSVPGVAHPRSDGRRYLSHLRSQLPRSIPATSRDRHSSGKRSEGVVRRLLA